MGDSLNMECFDMIRIGYKLIVKNLSAVVINGW